MSTILITGVAGFIGSHCAQLCLAQGHRVIGIDNLNDYYDVELKRDRLRGLETHARFIWAKADISKAGDLERACKGENPTHILHLAAQAGVRYSLENPQTYIQSNVMGHLNVLEFARHLPALEHLVYASSSSVYGERSGGPFSEEDIVRRPASVYAATKLSGEMLAESYASLYGIPQTGLRFFTVYGPMGRPDMAYYIFTQKILSGQALTLFAPHEMYRDFTYIDDIVGIIPRILHQTPRDRTHAIYNLGCGRPRSLLDLVKSVESACGQTTSHNIMDKQNGDVSSTYADISAAKRDFDFNPQTCIEDGIATFVGWYRSYYML